MKHFGSTITLIASLVWLGAGVVTPGVNGTIVGGIALVLAALANIENHLENQ